MVLSQACSARPLHGPGASDDMAPLLHGIGAGSLDYATLSSGAWSLGQSGWAMLLYGFDKEYMAGILCQGSSLSLGRESGPGYFLILVL